MSEARFTAAPQSLALQAAMCLSLRDVELNMDRTAAFVPPEKDLVELSKVDPVARGFFVFFVLFEAVLPDTEEGGAVVGKGLPSDSGVGGVSTEPRCLPVLSHSSTSTKTLANANCLRPLLLVRRVGHLSTMFPMPLS